jgi:hypothetical protein
MSQPKVVGCFFQRGNVMNVFFKRAATVVVALAGVSSAVFGGLTYFNSGAPVAAVDYKAGDGGKATAKGNSEARGGTGGKACDRGNGGNGGDAYADGHSKAYGGEGGEGACSDRPSHGGRAEIPDEWKSIPLPNGLKWADIGKGGDSADPRQK